MTDPTPAELPLAPDDEETRTTVIGDTRVTYPVATTVTYELVYEAGAAEARDGT